jgi:two-component system chemotaxis response regulator CheY
MESTMKRCLIVDDSRIIRKVTRKILEGMDFAIDEAEDGSSALEICRRNMPVAVLLDANMPGRGSAEFLRLLRHEDGGDKPIVLLVISENNIGQIAEAVNAGANEYIMKPFDSGVVEAKFADVGLA